MARAVTSLRARRPTRNKVHSIFSGARRSAGPAYARGIPAFDDELRKLLAENLARFTRRTHPAGNRRRAGVAVTIVATGDGEAAFVLTRRASGLRSHGGQWALPGGSVDGGESPVDAARRELAEEVALHVEPDDVLGVLDDYPTRSGFVIAPVVVWCRASDGMSADAREVRSVHLVPLAELDREDSPRIVATPDGERPLIQLPLLDHLISAPTAALLHQFHEVAVHGRATRVDHYDQPKFAWG